MARARLDLYSTSLELATSVTVLFPETEPEPDGMPVLYLLHGLSDDDTGWTRMTSVERYVEPLGLCVVMPQVHRSFYADEVLGGKYWTYLTDELPARLDGWLRLSHRPSRTFVAGLSMGAYGALKWALREPARFGAVAGPSGALDIHERVFGPALDSQLADRVFGGRSPRGGPDDLAWLAAQLPAAGRPRIYVCCGTEDELLPDVRAFVAACESAGVELTTSFDEGGHEWAYWDR